MAVRLSAFIILLILTYASGVAQQLQPGYVDPRPVLDAAGRVIGVDNVKCITISGTGYAGMVGQQHLSDKNVDWPRGEPLANYTCAMNWEAGTMKEEFDRKPGLNPPRGSTASAGWVARRSSSNRIRHSWSTAGTPGTWMGPEARRLPRRRRTRTCGSSKCG